MQAHQLGRAAAWAGPPRITMSAVGRSMVDSSCRPFRALQIRRPRSEQKAAQGGACFQAAEDAIPAARRRQKGDDRMWDSLWLGASIATMQGDAPFGALPDAALAVLDGRIAWLGPEAELPPGSVARKVHRVHGWITPGLVDCHTHLVYGGTRAAEWERRLRGVSYEQIAREGGGIRATVAATRLADEDTLFAAAKTRLATLMAEGVVAVEIKSGYGLDPATEARCLRVARRLGAETPAHVVTSFLGAHAVPPEFEGRPDAAMEAVIAMLPELAAEGLVDAVDAFCETIAFDAAQVRRLFEQARALGLRVKLHADQLSDGGGGALAAEFGALSADHLEYLSAEGAAAMARAGTVAVLLPGAAYFLRETQMPPVALLRAAGVRMAVATDCNPGTSPCTSLLLMLNMACTLFRLTPEEALAGVTREAARALGLEAEYGVLAVGRRADFVVWDVGSPTELCYQFGARPVTAVVRRGVEAGLR
jgi:imidazolonepropionase